MQILKSDTQSREVEISKGGMKMNKWIKLIICILVSHAAGLVGGLFSTPSIAQWYANLNKPWFTPPGWIFAPVWLVLYTLIGIALYLVWIEKEKKNATNTTFSRPFNIAIIAFGLQLILNALWSALFFGLRSPLLGLIEIAILWVVIIVTMIYFFRIRNVAGWLFIPYIIWVSFAVMLNIGILLLN